MNENQNRNDDLNQTTTEKNEINYTFKGKIYLNFIYFQLLFWEVLVQVKQV